MKLIPQEPFRYVDSPYFCKPGMTVKFPCYHVGDEARRLEERRRELGLSLRVAAERLGLNVVELSDLEHGRAVVANDEWLTLLSLLGGPEEDEPTLSKSQIRRHAIQRGKR